MRVDVVRYEHAAPGELLHIDIKKLGRIVRPSHRVTGDRRDSVDGLLAMIDGPEVRVVVMTCPDLCGYRANPARQGLAPHRHPDLRRLWVD